MILEVLCAICLLLSVIYVRRRSHTLSTFKRANIPGPEPSFLWGNLMEIYKNGHLVMQKRWHEQYGPIVGYYFGLRPVLLIADPELLKTVLLKEFHNFADRSDLVSDGPGGGLENGLTVLAGQRWKDVRSTLTPSFTSKKLKQVSPEVSVSVDEFMRNVDEDFKKGNECDIYELYQALTLDTILRTGMGVDFGIQKDVSNSKILKQLKVLFAFDISIAGVVLMSFPLLLKLFGKSIARLRMRVVNDGENPVGILKSQCADVVKVRRNNPQTQRVDLLQLMIDAQMTEQSSSLDSLIIGDDAEEREMKHEAKTKESCPAFIKNKGLTDSEIIDNAFLVLLAGYETTSSSLAFITRMLLRFPEVQAKVREELIAATNNGTVFEFEKLQRCQYVEAVIQETLRMYPPVFFFTTRVAAAELKYGKMTIPKGVDTFASTVALHYNEEIFPNPHEFQPERFLPENKTSAMAWAWQPFGAGPRNCIGMRFAQMEMKISLAKLLTKYKISSVREPLHNTEINIQEVTVIQQIKDPLLCKLAKLDG